MPLAINHFQRVSSCCPGGKMFISCRDSITLTLFVQYIMLVLEFIDKSFVRIKGSLCS